MKKFLTIALALLICISASADKKNKKATQAYKYEIEKIEAGAASNGVQAVYVQSYMNNIKNADQVCRRNAVHGVIFKGYSGRGDYHPALASDPTAQQDHKEFFDAFFADNGDYNKYVASTSASGPQYVKIKKIGYKVGLVVYVNVAALRRDLEKAGVIKGMSSVF